MSFQFDIRDQVTPTVNAVYGRLAPGRRRAFMGVLGRAGEKVFRSHFTSNDQNFPNKKGWGRKHFWSRIRRATAYMPSATTDDTSMLSIADPALRMKVKGGTIRPKEAKTLALPMNAAAYAAGSPRAGILGNLNFIPAWADEAGRLRGYLGRTEAGKLVLYYRLLTFVNVPADPNALPARGGVLMEMEKVARRFVLRGETA